MSETEKTTNAQDTDTRYYCRIECGRNPREGDEKDKGRKYLYFEYPSLTYGGLVMVQEVLVKTVLPTMARIGKMMARSLGQAVELPPAIFQGDLPPQDNTAKMEKPVQKVR